MSGTTLVTSKRWQIPARKEKHDRFSRMKERWHKVWFARFRGGCSCPSGEPEREVLRKRGVTLFGPRSLKTVKHKRPKQDGKAICVSIEDGKRNLQQAREKSENSDCAFQELTYRNAANTKVANAQIAAIAIKNDGGESGTRAI